MPKTTKPKIEKTTTTEGNTIVNVFTKNGIIFREDRMIIDPNTIST